MNWKGILRYILSILPVDYIVIVLLDWLTEQVEKTSNKLDDKAVEILRIILYQAFNIDQGQLSSISGIPGASGVPGLPNSNPPA